MDKTMAKRDTRRIKEKIKLEFIQGVIDQDNIRTYPSMRELSRKYKTTANTVSRGAKNGDWILERQRFQNQLTEKIRQKKANKMAERVATFDQNCLTIANGLIREVGRRLQSNLAVLQSDDKTEALKVYELRDLSQIALNGQKLGKLALGEASEIHKGTIDVDGDESFKRALQQLRAMREERAKSHPAVH